jgi:hypothetical protein
VSDQADKHSTDTDDTKQAPSGDEPETTATDTSAADRAELAWSDDTDEIAPKRYGRIVSAGLVALLAGIVAVAAWFAATYFGHAPSKNAEPSHVPG